MIGYHEMVNKSCEEKLGYWDKFTGAVISFGLEGYHSMMKRKTFDEKDLKALDLLKKMVADLEEKMEKNPR